MLDIARFLERRIRKRWIRTQLRSLTIFHWLAWILSRAREIILGGSETVSCA